MMIREGERFIREGERVIRRTEEWAVGTLGVFGARLVEVFERVPFHRMFPWSGSPAVAEVIAPASEASVVLPSMYKTGLIPAELRADPFPGDTVPWSIQEAQKEKDRVRKMRICMAVAAVSWSVTVVSILRSMGFL